MDASTIVATTTNPAPPLERAVGTPAVVDETLATTEEQKNAAEGGGGAGVVLPRVKIEFCTQCRWMLRAAYSAQELLSTFGTTIGEVALVPGIGGVFRVEMTYIPPMIESSGVTDSAGEVEAKNVLLWDRKAEGGFPETKVLKQRVRDYLDPGRDLGHSDRGGKKKAASAETEKEGKKDANAAVCEDCR